MELSVVVVFPKAAEKAPTATDSAWEPMLLLTQGTAEDTPGRHMWGMACTCIPLTTAESFFMFTHHAHLIPESSIRMFGLFSSWACFCFDCCWSSWCVLSIPSLHILYTQQMSPLSLQLLKKGLFKFYKVQCVQVWQHFFFWILHLDSSNPLCISIPAILSTLRSQGVSHLSLAGSEVLPFTPRCLTHIELAFVCGSREALVLSVCTDNEFPPTQWPTRSHACARLAAHSPPAPSGLDVPCSPSTGTGPQGLPCGAEAPHFKWI